MSRAREQFRAARDQAHAEGSMTYEGSSCSKCSGTQRYTSSSGCIKCVRRVTDAHRQRNPGYTSKRGAPMYERDVSMKAKAPWPKMKFKDAETTDHIGSRTISRVSVQVAGYESSIAGIY